MHTQKQSILYAFILALSAPQLAHAQFSVDAATHPGNVSFSSNVLPLQSNIPPLNNAVKLGTDLYTSNSQPRPSTYNPQGIFKVSDIQQAANDAKPNVFKDLFLGPSANRALHPTTVKIFDILGKAQKGLQTYKFAKGAYDAIAGKNSNGAIGNIRNILLLYGVIDPNAAVATAATIGTTQTAATIASATSNSDRIQKAALGQPVTPSQWYVKGINNDAIASMAAQTGPDMILSPDGQQRLQSEEEIAAASAEAIEIVISDAATSAVQVRQYEQTAQTQAASSAEVAQGAQKRKSTQQAVKDLNTLAGIQANLSAIQASTLAELNDNSLRNLGGMASIVGMQRVQNDKLTTLQLVTALNGRQLANINSGVHRSHNYTVMKDLQQRKSRQTSLQNIVIPRPIKQQANPNQAQGAQK